MNPKGAMLGTPPPGAAEPWLRLFLSAFAFVLTMALLKLGNPIILDRLIDPPRDIWELIFLPWPARWGYVLLAVCACLGFLPGLGVARHVPKWVIILPCTWFTWQLLSGFNSIDAQLTRPTLLHFAACLVCFLLGLFGLGCSQTLRIFWNYILVGFVVVLWTGFEQHYGGLAATREMFYQQPNWQQYPPEYIKKIESNRIFSTLVYPNALAAAILLLLPPLLLKVWLTGSLRSWTVRAVLAGMLAYAAAACLFWSGSKSGWLIALVLMLLMLLHQPFARRLKIAMLVAVLLAGLVGFFVQFAPYFQRGAPSVSARMEYWRAAYSTALDNPLLGTGPGTFGVAYRKIKPPGAEMTHLTHNDYLEQASDSGWPGCVCYAAFIFGSILLLPRVPQIARRKEALVVWLGLTGWALQSFVEFLLYIPAVTWIAFALLGWLWSLRQEQ